LNTSGMPMRPSSICFFADAYPASNRRMNPIWKNMPEAVMACRISSAASIAIDGGFSQNVGFFRAAAAITSSRCVSVGLTMTSASTAGSSINASGSV